ncbi:signal peptidase I [Streptomyces sp. NPDC049915]|uniref:signal peptidase I n=1 Tax=Streptomyces sp. NPDC049915 TaxID=3155510 RepID=UPI003428C538
MSGKGRGLAIAAVVVGVVGVLLGLGGAGYARAGYGGSVMRGESMRPTYRPGDRIMFERIDGSQVRRGDVVLFSAPDRYGFDDLLVERVVAVGGDRISCCTGKGPGGHVTLNGRPLQEPYVRGGQADDWLAGTHYDVRVPEGRLFLLGDNRGNARDSRAFLDDQGGTVPLSAVRGRVIDDYTVPGLVGTALILAAVLVLTGVGLGIAAVAVRRRARTLVPPAPPWVMQQP